MTSSNSTQVRLVVVGLLSLFPALPALAQDVTAAARAGIYADSDKTEVIRTLASAEASGKRFTLSATEAVDVITSASIDVRTSPFVDALSSASQRSPTMHDRRFETTFAGGWNDHAGHVLTTSFVYATELDYTSIGGGLSGAWEVAERNTTLFAGVNAAANQVGSVIDPMFSKSLSTAGYTAGLGQVLGVRDVLRIRYDGNTLDGYQASPYRSVRFGNWQVQRMFGGTMTFTNTIGSANGLPEQLPQTRIRHAGTLEWIHALGHDVALASSYRLGYDSWGILAHTAALELRANCFTDWQLRGGYRFYDQGAADFWQDKYVQDPSTYTYYTSDKELGEVRGHSVTFDFAHQVWKRASDGVDGIIDLKVDALYYTYPGFPLLSSRESLFAQLGLRLDF